MSIVFDTYAWIEYFIGSSFGKIVKRYLKKDHCLTPSIVMAELAWKYFREHVNPNDIKLRLLFILKKTDIININHDIAITGAKFTLFLRENAKKLKMKKKPGLSDGLVYAMTKIFNGKLLTGDLHFKGLPDVIFLPEEKIK
ncbi:MAG: PIN domain-containing protein [Candidatus Njordarchaeales archaeon]